ncbi:MAG TPA: Gfo/Idh/MocA family oxidoreductase [Deltaproteobacteria bacterium]|nr:Gfo/Idh/MocA family oxidoreductase [Deltaproteobacteria bacterium]
MKKKNSGEKYRVGIIGCGRIASLFEDDPLREHPCTHAGVYNAVSETEIAAASDFDAVKLRAFSKRWNVKSVYKNYKKMLDKESLEIVSVCTPTPTHSEVVVEAAKSGVSAIFCEKPIATSLKEADKMIEACNKSGVKLIINYPRRWNPYYRHIKQLINSGEIGDTESITGHYTSGLLMMGTHLLDIFRFLVGDVKWVFGSVEDINPADFVAVKPSENFSTTDPCGTGFLCFKNRTSGFVDGSIRKKYFIFEIDIQGTSGRIRISDNGRSFELWGIKESENYGGYKELDLKPFLALPSAPAPASNRMWSSSVTCNVKAVEEIIECVEQNKESVSSGAEGRAALELALAFHESSAVGAKVRLPLQNKNLRVVSK